MLRGVGMVARGGGVRPRGVGRCGLLGEVCGLAGTGVWPGWEGCGMCGEGYGMAERGVVAIAHSMSSTRQFMNGGKHWRRWRSSGGCHG